MERRLVDERAPSYLTIRRYLRGAALQSSEPL